MIVNDKKINKLTELAKASQSVKTGMLILDAVEEIKYLRHAILRWSTAVSEYQNALLDEDSKVNEVFDTLMDAEEELNDIVCIYFKKGE